MTQARTAQIPGTPQIDRRALILGASAAAAAAPLGLTGCATPNPEIGRNQFIIVDEGTISQMSLEAWSELVRQTPVWRNPRQQERLARIGGRIAIAANRQNLQWEYALFDRPEKNAFVLPGGKVGFYRGLMEICDRDDHVATVLGHETAHVVARHAAERYSREVVQSSALRLAGAATDSQILLAAVGLGAQVGLSLPFSREQEAEADRLGVNYLHAAGYDPRESIAFWRRMAQEGGSRGPEFLSTHPDPANRIEALRGYINARGWGPV